MVAGQCVCQYSAVGTEKACFSVWLSGYFSDYSVDFIERNNGRI